MRTSKITYLNVGNTAKYCVGTSLNDTLVVTHIFSSYTGENKLIASVSLYQSYSVVVFSVYLKDKLLSQGKNSILNETRIVTYMVKSFPKIHYFYHMFT